MKIEKKKKNEDKKLKSEKTNNENKSEMFYLTAKKFEECNFSPKINKDIYYKKAIDNEKKILPFCTKKNKNLIRKSLIFR